jgi:hypothetical protein
MKNAGMRIRVEPELREEFVRLCKHKDMPAAQVLRAFMRDFVERQGKGPQIEIVFAGDDTQTIRQDSKA